MTGNEYQQAAVRTTIDKLDFDLEDPQAIIAWMALGLSGEAGEVANLVKKGVFHQHGLNKEKIKEELGDVLWYISALCTALDLSLEEVMEKNINKLLKRYPDGYSSEDSIRRKV